MANTSPKNKNYYLFISQILLVIVIIAIIFVGFMTFSRYTTIQSLTKQNNDIKENITSYEQDSEFQNILFAMENIDSITKKSIIWTDFVSMFANTTPDDATITSLVASGSRISANMDTSNIQQVADTYRAFADNDSFEKVFISSISESGNSGYTFPLQAIYSPKK